MQEPLLTALEQASEEKKKESIPASAPEDKDPYKKDLPSMMDFFGPAVARMQSQSGLPSSQLMFDLGKEIGKAMASKMTSSNLDGLMEELSHLWDRLEMAKLEVESKDPLRFVIRRCMICGQTPGVMPARCYFHEGVYQGIMDEKLGGEVSVKQLESFLGEAGTLCRRYEVTAKSKQ